MHNYPTMQCSKGNGWAAYSCKIFKQIVWEQSHKRNQQILIYIYIYIYKWINVFKKYI